MGRSKGGARFARFLRNSLWPRGSGSRLPTLSGLSLLLEVSAVGLQSNCSCRLIALGAGFLGYFRPQKMGYLAAAPSGLLGFQVGSPRLVGQETKGFAPAGGASALTVGFLRQQRRSERSEGPEWA